jgi:hypothetical protein
LRQGHGNACFGMLGRTDIGDMCIIGGTKDQTFSSQFIHILFNHASLKIKPYFQWIFCFADITMQDQLVIYDNEQGRLGWRSSQCDKKPKSKSAIFSRIWNKFVVTSQGWNKDEGILVH